ncbi:MAG: CHASE4 domain-containing protein [FCB group bacterium]|jgi:sensor domain CHASE-containing protein/two-component sensor histidine kinase|nr:CHASE4 domain-containing protein [FCB group bacterium]
MELRNFTLRTKIVSATLATFLLASGGLYLAASLVLLEGFAALERDSMHTDVERVEGALGETFTSLERFCGDWAGWTDTRDFVFGKNETYVADNLQDSAFLNASVNFMGFLDLSGRVVHLKSMDLNEEQEVASSPSLLQAISDPVLRQHTDPNDLIHGILMLPEGPLLVGVAPITNSEFQLPINGTFIAGKFLNDDTIAELSHRTRLTLAFYRWDQEDTPADVRSAKVLMQAGTPRFVQAHGNELIVGYSQINDVAGKPALILRVEQPRQIFQHGQHTARLFMGILLAMGFLTFVILFLVIDWTVLKPLAALNERIVRVRDSKDLTTRIEVRTRDELGALAELFNDTTDSLRKAETELEAAHRSLMEKAREAGMADVATGILHNVGNVLNSVNISTTTLKRQVSESRMKNLVNAAELLDEHRDDLGHFLTQDPRGSKLPPYLIGLAKHLKEEQDSLVGRLGELDGHIQHIADIIALQQSFAKNVGLVERTDLAELADQAIKVNAVVLSTHEIELERDYAPLPAVLVDRYQVLQILINLIGNAGQALRDVEQPSKQIRLRIEAIDGERIQLSVSDNGVGIAAENLDRIFAQGFTTRPEGHGFGLHMAANAAGQLGGSLTVHSDGLGKGATFVLEFPYRIAEG